ncbi:hypothetical protein BH11MYX1_BH11MYX1_20760 [soil metagenome]
MTKVLLALGLVAACGGDGGGPQMCGADHCGLQGHTVVKWTFDASPARLFPGDSCVDFGINKVRVDAQSDADGTVVTAIDDCGAGQVTFDGLPAGTYTLFVDPQDFAGNTTVMAPTTGPATAGQYQADTTTTINVDYTSWLGGPYTGTFLWRLKWGGQSCATATVPVDTQVVTISSGGVASTVTASPNNQKLDGTDPKPCFAYEENFPQSATGMPFGPAQLTVQGLAAGAVVYTTTFDTFIGAGITHPTVTYDAPAAM